MFQEKCEGQYADILYALPPLELYSIMYIFIWHAKLCIVREKCEDQYEDRCQKVYKIKAGGVTNIINKKIYLSIFIDQSIAESMHKIPNMWPRSKLGSGGEIFCHILIQPIFYIICNENCRPKVYQNHITFLFCFHRFKSLRILGLRLKKSKNPAERLKIKCTNYCSTLDLLLLFGPSN